MLNLDKKKTYLLACSYGPDSMALFHMLLKEGYKFSVAHVNYHLREESNSEEQGLREYCKKNNIDCYVLENKDTINRNIEAKCREIRYSFFKSVFDQHHFDYLLVAHNEDDNIETYLLQKKRKNLPLYYGIKEETKILDVPVLRPLLKFSKAELLLYCEVQNVPYAIDKTNLEITFERNKIRHQIVSRLSVDERQTYINIIKSNNIVLEHLLEEIKKTPDKISVISNFDDIEFAYYLNDRLHEIGYLKGITYKQSVEVMKILYSNKPNIRINLTNGFYIEKAYDELWFGKEKEFLGYSYLIDKPSLIDNDYFYADFVGDTKNRNVTPNDYPLTIRTYKQGDKYQIKDYVVQVRRLFIDWKMPSELRKRWPLVVNKDGKIIYIPRYQKNFVPDNHSNFYVKECFTLK